MARLILKSPYIKSTGAAAGYLKYIATRERVEILPDDRPPTRKQEQLIAKLTEDFPDTKNLYEYMDYADKPTKFHASAFITVALESNWDSVHQSEQYMKYIATRPRAERFGSHGLFSDEDTVSLDKAMTELENYTGNVWTHIISLKREDAERLGYDNAAAWRDLLRSHRNDIAEAMKISPHDFRWYAAFHDEGHHPHIHMVVYAENSNRGHLSEKGIEQIKSMFANEIFKDEMYNLYDEKSRTRDRISDEAKEKLTEIADRISKKDYSNSEICPMLISLADKLKEVSGKKQYGYLPKSLKKDVDDIVKTMAKDKDISELYSQWCDIQQRIVVKIRR